MRGDPSGHTLVAGVEIHEPNRILYPGARITKHELAEWYLANAEVILPQISGRPLAVWRSLDALRTIQYVPHDAESNAFADPAIRRHLIAEKKKIGEYLIVDSVAALVALAAGDVVDAGVWNATIDDLARPDRIVFDLDPGAMVSWPELTRAALTVHRALRAIGLESHVKTSGRKGLHVVVPFAENPTWQLAYRVARDFAGFLATTQPRTFSAEVGSTDPQRIVVDYNRNYRGARCAPAFLPRPLSNAPISMPLPWTALRTQAQAEDFTLRSRPILDRRALSVESGSASNRLDEQLLQALRLAIQAQ